MKYSKKVLNVTMNVVYKIFQENAECYYESHIDIFAMLFHTLFEVYSVIDEDGYVINEDCVDVVDNVSSNAFP
jgi:hypothetical protein